MKSAFVYSLLLPVGLAAQVPSSEPPPPASDAASEAPDPSMKVTPVSRETSVLEEKTLLTSALLTSRTALKAKATPISDRQRKAGNMRLNNAGDDRDMPNAMRLYGFTLEPGEKLSLSMTSEDAGKLWMKVVPPPKKDGMAGEILAANRVPKPLRASRFGIRNTTEQPYKLVVQVYGNAGIPYKIAIERSK